MRFASDWRNFLPCSCLKHLVIRNPRRHVALHPKLARYNRLAVRARGLGHRRFANHWDLSNAMRLCFLVGLLAAFTVGADVSKVPTQSSAAPKESGYQLTVRFGDGDGAPRLTTDVDLGAPFMSHKGLGLRVLAIDGRIDAPKDGKFHGFLHHLDLSALKTELGRGLAPLAGILCHSNSINRTQSVSQVVFFAFTPSL